MIAKSTEILFSEISQFIAESRSLLDSGALMEMHGLDEQVRVLCEAVLQLSQEERVAASVPMQKLLTDLKKLGEDMVISRDKLADEVRQLSSQKKAAHAYKIVDASDSFGKRDDDEE